MKIAVIHGNARELFDGMGSLLEAMVRLGHTVCALAPTREPDVAVRFESLGIDYSMIPLTRSGFTPFSDIGSLLHLKQALFRIRPGLVLATTFKAMAYGPLAARMAWVGEEKKVFALVDGAGFVADGESGLLRRIGFGVAKSLCRAGFRSCDGILFRRAGDEVLFRRLGVIPDRVETSRLDEAEAEDREAADNAVLRFMGLL